MFIAFIAIFLFHVVAARRLKTQGNVQAALGGTSKTTGEDQLLRAELLHDSNVSPHSGLLVENAVRSTIALPTQSSSDLPNIDQEDFEVEADDNAARLRIHAKRLDGTPSAAEHFSNVSNPGQDASGPMSMNYTAEEDVLASPSRKRVEFMENRRALDLEGARDGLERFSDNISLPFAGTHRKVAFIFMLYDGLDHNGVWEMFFSQADRNKFSIYTHRARPNGQTPEPLGAYGAKIVRTAPQGWCALSGLQVVVFAEALSDPANVQFILLSQNAIPLKPFNYIHGNLEASAGTSKICYASLPSQPNAIKQAISNEKSLSGNTCHFRDNYAMQDPRVRKHHQWVVLSRQHAYYFVRFSIAAIEHYQATWQIAAPELGDHFDGCSDEATVSLALILSEQVDIEEKCLTWLSWRNCFFGTDLTLGESPFDAMKLITSGAFWDIGKPANMTGRTPFMLSASTALNGFPHFWGPPAEPATVPLRYLEQLVMEEGFMFGRKFNRGVKVDYQSGVKSDKIIQKFGTIEQPQQVNLSTRPTLELIEILPVLWELVDAEKTSKRVWSRLDSEGVPAEEDDD